MKYKFLLNYILKKSAVFLLLPVLLLSCSGEPDPSDPSEPSKTVGVGRAAELLIQGEEGGKDETSSGDNSGETEDGTKVEGISWNFSEGKYTYHFPDHDRSTLSDLTDINNTSRALFSDQGKDTTGSWYFGKTNYNMTTGEVTYVWDRADDTQQFIKENLGIYRGDETRKVCYFTFDCGYENGYTNAILDVLLEKEVSGVFFLTGQYVDTAKEQIRRMIDEGHILGNHTDDHPNMTQQTAEQFIEQIKSLEEKVKDAFPDSQPILYYRPPYGAANEWTLKLAAKMDIRTVLWSFTYKDYDPNDQLDYASALEKVKNGLHPGCVYLFHTVSKTNSEILGEAIDWIRSQGYDILPICDIDMNRSAE